MTPNKKIVVSGIATAVLGLGAAGAWATGFFPGIPFVGGATYCEAFTNGSCTQYVPAGPTVFAGTENTAFDVNAPGSLQQTGPATVGITLPQLGQGPMVDLTTVGTAQTVPANTPWYFLDGAQGSALTVTMPAAPTEGYLQHVVCEAATVGTLTVAANTGQTLKGNPNVACTAGVGYAWRYQASNTTWYRVQ